MVHTVGFVILIMVVSMQTAASDMDWETMRIKVAAQDRSTAVDLLEQELYTLQDDAHRTVEDFLRRHFSVNFTDHDHLVQNGLILYTTQEVHGHPRTGDNPLQIKAKGVFGNALTDIKISSFDARRIHGSKHNLQLLKECRTATIIGP